MMNPSGLDFTDPEGSNYQPGQIVVDMIREITLGFTFFWVILDFCISSRTGHRWTIAILNYSLGLAKTGSDIWDWSGSSYLAN